MNGDHSCGHGRGESPRRTGPLRGRTHLDLRVYEESVLASEQDLHHRLRLSRSSLRDEGAEDGTTNAELGQVIQWLTGFDETALGGQLGASATVADSFEEARVNPYHPADRHPDQVVRPLRARCAPDNVWSRRNGGARW